MDKIMTEQNFSNSNRADPTSAAKIGKLLGVDAIVVGSITEFGNETKKKNIGGGGGNWGGFGIGGIGHSKSNANVVDHRAHREHRHRRDHGRGRGPGPRRRAPARRCWAAAATGTERRRQRRLRLQRLSESTIIGEATKAAVDKLSLGR